MTEDISALVSFNNHIAVVWTNQSNPVSNTLHMALHPDTSGDTSGWKYYSATLPSGVELEYDTFGSPDDPALLLVMGFTAQMIAWDERFCAGLADRGR